uniref:Centrosomin N-terminal motif 1 domain-containing protein n=1 Tax=Hippocampus comes TaxID=109280 RepID=A0A3Q2XAC4_HIPCM
MSNGYRTLSQHLNDLKKENFSLKLRIYFLEERIQQKYEESSEDGLLRGCSANGSDQYFGVHETREIDF